MIANFLSEKIDLLENNITKIKSIVMIYVKTDISTSLQIHFNEYRNVRNIYLYFFLNFFPVKNRIKIFDTHCFEK